jgi:selenocysteine-specific translation elongation factor
MRNVTFAYLGTDDAAGKFAKKGTATDITLFNAKTADAHLNIVTPSRFPEKIMSLLYALDMADEIVLQPAAIDRSLGEMVVAAELLGKTRGFVRPSAKVTMPELQALLSKTALKDLTASEDNDAVFREKLYERAGAGQEGPLLLPVDHSFPVKGVGTVVLGLVRRGEVAAHQTLQIHPSTKTLEVRSVQVHDVDQPKAGGRSRVGLAVKGVEPQDVSRGTVLAPAGALTSLAAGATLNGTIELHAFSKWQPRAAAVLHLFHLLQDVVVRVETIQVHGKQANVSLKLEGPLALAKEEPIVLVDVDNKAQRLVGRLRLA